jgi:hypothetical protein
LDQRLQREIWIPGCYQRRDPWGCLVLFVLLDGKMYVALGVHRCQPAAPDRSFDSIFVAEEPFIGDGPIAELEEALGYLLKARQPRAMAAVDSSLPQT